MKLSLWVADHVAGCAYSFTSCPPLGAEHLGHGFMQHSALVGITELRHNFFCRAALRNAVGMTLSSGIVLVLYLDGAMVGAFIGPPHLGNQRGENVMKNVKTVVLVLLMAVVLVLPLIVHAGDDDNNNGDSTDCSALPSHSELQTALNNVVDAGGNAGLANEMWGTTVNRDGIVCTVVFTGDDRGDQWPGSRVISAQKANTANAFSLPGNAGFGGALSSGNLYGTVLEQGSLLGLQFSNPVDPRRAYRGNAKKFGMPNDPMTGKRIGGVNIFGGGLALYDNDGNLVGGLGVSGDASCTDHVIAWKVRDALELDNVPGGVSTTDDDNLIVSEPVVRNTFQHPDCGGGVAAIIAALPMNFPIGPNP